MGIELNTNARAPPTHLPSGLTIQILARGGGGRLAGVHKIFFVWYPTFFQKNLSYDMRDCYYQKM